MEAEGGTAHGEVWVGGDKIEASRGPRGILSWVRWLYSLVSLNTLSSGMMKAQ